jgi:flagellar hook assembly protein FlgD
VYDVSGRVIKKIHRGKMDKGFHTFTWNGRNNTGNPVGSSVYFIVINAGENRITREVVLVR